MHFAHSHSYRPALVPRSGTNLYNPSDGSIYDPGVYCGGSTFSQIHTTDAMLWINILGGTRTTEKWTAWQSPSDFSDIGQVRAGQFAIQKHRIGSKYQESRYATAPICWD